MVYIVVANCLWRDAAVLRHGRNNKIDFQRCLLRFIIPRVDRGFTSRAYHWVGAFDKILIQSKLDSPDLQVPIQYWESWICEKGSRHVAHGMELCNNHWIAFGAARFFDLGGAHSRFDSFQPEIRSHVVFIDDHPSELASGSEV